MTMQFSQHVYGRVAQGYRGTGEGFQLAAVTDTLTERMDLVDNLNRLSFFNFRGGGEEVRYSFFCPVEGFVAFGCSRLAQDRTGSFGSFAHNLVCELSQFIESDVSPVAVLRSFATLSFQNEDALPQSRSLPLLTLPVDDQKPLPDAWRSFGLQLVDICLAKSGPAVPMVVLSDEDAWSVLAEVFRVLPRIEAAQFSFSTLFTAASDFAQRFRVVFVPDQDCVPTGSYVYKVLVPDVLAASPPKEAALTTFWRSHLEAGPDLLRLLHILRHAPERRDEALDILPRLLPLGSLFRNVIESLHVPGLLRLLLTDPDWLVQYGRAGAWIPYRQFSAAVWENPEHHLASLLTAADRLSQKELRDGAVVELAERVARDQTLVPLIEDLERSGHLLRFYEIASQLDMPVQCRLAESLRGRACYSNQLHDSVAQRVVERITMDDRPSGLERWLRAEAVELRSEPFYLAVVDLAEWIARRKGEGFRLSAYALTTKQYDRLLRAAWKAGSRYLSDLHLVRATYHEPNRQAFFSFVTEQFRRYDVEKQTDVLHACARVCGPRGASDEALLNAIDASAEAAYLARYYRTLLGKLYTMDEQVVRRLTMIERTRRRRFFGLFDG